jgi:hypothetical protein
MKHRFGLNALALSLGCFGASCGPSTITVTTTADGGPGSLRAAVASANAADPSSSVRIELPAGTYTLNLCGGSEGDLDLTTGAVVTLVGTADRVVIRQTCAGERVLESRGGALLALSNLTISGGALASQDATAPAQGGGVRAAGDVKLERVTFSNNGVTGAPGAPAQGGGLYVGGSLDSTNAGFDTNSATGGSGEPGGPGEGGGLFVVGAIKMSGGSVSANVASGGESRGGGIAQASTGTQFISITGTQFTNNSVIGGAGASGGASGTIRGATARGGALAASGSTQLMDALFAGNFSRGGTITRHCPTSSGCYGRGGLSHGGAVFSTETLSLTRGTYASNYADGGLGYSTTFSGLNVWMGEPAGAAFHSLAAVTINGGIYSLNGVSPAPGFGQPSASMLQAPSANVVGAQFNDNYNAFIVDNDIHVSKSQFTSTVFAAVSAGSIRAENVTFNHNGTAVDVEGTAELSNCTVTDNTNGIRAAAIVALQCTLTSNFQGTLQTPRLTAYATVAIPGDNPLCFSGFTTVTGSAWNWFGDSSCALAGEGDVQGVAATLAPLANYGGSVATRPPPSGSPLIDRVPITACASTVDARGVSRPQGGGCDVGAVEIAITE